MKIIVFAHGKIKNGPEHELISDYVNRFNKQFNNDFLTSLEISVFFMILVGPLGGDPSLPKQPLFMRETPIVPTETQISKICALRQSCAGAEIQLLRIARNLPVAGFSTLRTFIGSVLNA